LVFYKYNHLNPTELQTITEVAKTFLNFLNHYNFESPSTRRGDLTHEDASNYKINYTRWLVFCHVPAFCNSGRLVVALVKLKKKYTLCKTNRENRIIW